MPNSLYISKIDSRLCQGDLIEDLEYTFPKATPEEVILDKVTFPYAVVITQDCDLEQDFNIRDGREQKNQDKFLRTVSLLPAYTAEAVRQGVHLQEFGLSMHPFSTDQWKLLKLNQNSRYHFLKADLAAGIPEIVIDFKHCYTSLREDLYNMFVVKPEMIKYKIDILFREDLSRRFANYISRIALPELSTQSPSTTTVPISS